MGLRWGTARTLPKFLCCSMYCLFCVVLCTVVCKWVLYYCHGVATQLQLANTYIVSYHIISSIKKIWNALSQNCLNESYVMSCLPIKCDSQQDIQGEEERTRHKPCRLRGERKGKSSHFTKWCWQYRLALLSIIRPYIYTRYHENNQSICIIKSVLCQG
jgi:hypothetical protein